jgi:hypothetical protein
MYYMGAIRKVTFIHFRQLMFVKDGASQFQNFCVDFHQFQRYSLQADLVRLCYHKICIGWAPKMLTGAHRTLRMALA